MIYIHLSNIRLTRFFLCENVQIIKTNKIYFIIHRNKLPAIRIKLKLFSSCNLLLIITCAIILQTIFTYIGFQPNLIDFMRRQFKYIET